MKILATSDLHQWIPKWKELIGICKINKPDFVVISGDLFPKDSLEGQINFLPNLKKYATKIKDFGCEIILTLGNDDNQNTQEFMEQEDSNKTWHYIHNKVRIIKGYEFAGLSFVKDHPFGYKYWCRNEFAGQTHIDPFQRGLPLILDKMNEISIINDYKKFLEDRPSIMECLLELSNKTNNISKSIWVLHNPPFRTGLDTIANGSTVGSIAILEFIEKFQPMLTIHGHIHESYTYTNKWYSQIGKTLAIQAGQVSQKLHYAIINIEDGKIIDKLHSNEI